MTRLLLIPGLLCNESLWHGQIHGLGDCIQPIVPDVTCQESIPEMAQTVLDSAPQDFCLAGFSLGSQVALEIMRIASERVEKLALLSATSGGLMPPVKAAIENAMTMIQQGDFDKYVEQSYSTYVHPLRVNDAAVKRIFTEMARGVGPDAALRQMRALLSISGPFIGLGRIDCPTAIIGGRQDHRTTLEAHEELARHIRGSVLTIIEHSGHFTPIEQPSSVTEAMRSWLTCA